MPGNTRTFNVINFRLLGGLARHTDRPTGYNRVHLSISFAISYSCSPPRTVLSVLSAGWKCQSAAGRSRNHPEYEQW
jgi:hypothetical protein